MCVFVFILNSSAARWFSVPRPADETFRAPGFFFASAMNSAMLFTGRLAGTANTSGKLSRREIGVKSRSV